MTTPTPDEALAAYEDICNTVVIYDQSYQLRGSNETVHQYQAWCRRCLRNVQSPGLRGGRSIWATKAPAVRAAKYHLTGHDRMEPIYHSTSKIVDFVRLP